MQKQNRQKLVLFFMVSVLAMFFSISCSNNNSAELGVDFTWEGTKRCTGISPEIKVTNIPQGTVSFNVKLRDLDAPDYNHGEGIIPNNGSGVIPKKAIKNNFGLENRYKGPCPPQGAHRYEFIVKALDKDGKVLAQGSLIKPFS